MPHFLRLTAAALLTGFLAAPALAAAGDVPDNLQGTWAENGACSVMAKTIDIIGNTLAMGDGAPAVVTYAANDSPANYDAIHFAEEGDVSNFEYVADRDVLAFHPEGYGMGRTVVYQRCADDPGMSAGNAGAASGDSATQLRCGWLVNLSEGNTSLVDRDGTWPLEAGGDPSTIVDGYENLPGITLGEHVSTHGDYGYACTCMDVSLSADGQAISHIYDVQLKPLAQCKADKSLPARSDW